MSTFSQHSETDLMESVIIGSAAAYAESPHYVERVNDLQEGGTLPTATQLTAELSNFKSVLESFGVTVYQPAPVGKIVYDQLTPRDLGVAIGNKFLLCNMAKQSRRYECAGIFDIIFSFIDHEPNVIIPPSDCLIEGGDVIVDKGRIFVGVSHRTNARSVDFLHQKFGSDFEIIPVHLNSADPAFVLHLDCVFNPVGPADALIYAAGIKDADKVIGKYYNGIEVTQEEQRALATNVLSISTDTILSRDHECCKRINDKLREKYNVVAIPFNGVPATGGSLRCASLPLVRKTTKET